MDDMDMSAAVQATTAAKRALLSMLAQLEQSDIRNCQLSFSLALAVFLLCLFTGCNKGETLLPSNQLANSVARAGRVEKWCKQMARELCQ
jgi:hypothetical protein